LVYLRWMRLAALQCGKACLAGTVIQINSGGSASASPLNLLDI